MSTILQVFQAASGQWGGRILRDGEEDGRVAGCDSPDAIIWQWQDWIYKPVDAWLNRLWAKDNPS